MAFGFKANAKIELAIYSEQCVMSGRRCSDPEAKYDDRARDTPDLVWFEGTESELRELASALEEHRGQWGWRAASAIREYLD